MRCDIVVGFDPNGFVEVANPPVGYTGTQWYFYAITDKGVGILSRLLPNSALRCTAEFNHYIRVSEATKTRTLQELYDLGDVDYVDVRVMDDDFAVVSLNVRFLCDEERMRQTVAAMNVHFTPLFDAAFEARDKREISKLYYQFPLQFERSFLIDRIRQTFPEFSQPGMTISNWYKDEA